MKNFCDRIGLDEAFAPVILSAANRLGTELDTAVSTFYSTPDMNAEAASALLADTADAAGIAPYTRNAAFVLRAFFLSKEDFLAECGKDEEIYYSTARDLVFKVRECYRRYGIIGTTAISWHTHLLRRKILALGRLQYHIVPFHPEFCRTEHLSLRHGDPVIKMHIPSSGKLTEGDCLDSYSRAYRYFRPHFTSDIVPFTCFTWMLDPAIAAAIPDGGIAAFASHFTIFDCKDDPKNQDLWRVFGRDYAPDEPLPRTTRLQAHLADRIEGGGCMRTGFGAFGYDGTDILK